MLQARVAAHDVASQGSEQGVLFGPGVCSSWWQQVSMMVSDLIVCTVDWCAMYC
jgi:hypothetical protein